MRYNRGRWIKVNLLSHIFGVFRCSECGCFNERTRYCPDCGAWMGEVDQ